MGDLKKEDMTVGQLRNYGLIKPVAEAVGNMPFVGETALNVANAVCSSADAVDEAIGGAVHAIANKLHLPSGQPLSERQPYTACQAVRDTLGELNAPAFPKQSAPSAHVGNGVPVVRL